jgi:hypothetical protein
VMNQFNSSRCMNYTIRAAALAHLAREREDGRLMHFAKCIHVKAVRECNAALKSDQVNWDSTLVSCLVLGLFEVRLIVVHDVRFTYKCWLTLPRALQ